MEKREKKDISILWYSYGVIKYIQSFYIPLLRHSSYFPWFATVRASYTWLRASKMRRVGVLEFKFWILYMYKHMLIVGKGFKHYIKKHLLQHLKNATYSLYAVFFKHYSEVCCKKAQTLCSVFKTPYKMNFKQHFQKCCINNTLYNFRQRFKNAPWILLYIAFWKRCIKSTICSVLKMLCKVFFFFKKIYFPSSLPDI